jgi:hypothetical protein
MIRGLRVISDETCTAKLDASSAVEFTKFEKFEKVKHFLRN